MIRRILICLGLTVVSLTPVCVRVEAASPSRHTCPVPLGN